MLYQAELRSLPKARKNYGNSLEMQVPFFRGKPADVVYPGNYFWGTKAKATAASTQMKAAM